MRTKIATGIYFLLSIAALLAILMGLEKYDPYSAFIGGTLLYLFGRDVRHVLRSEE